MSRRGTHPRRAAPPAAVVGVLLVVMGVPLVVAGVPLAGRPARAEPAPTAAGGSTYVLTVDSVAPTVLRPRQPLVLRGWVTADAGAEPLRAPSVLVAATGAVGTRYDLQRAMTEPDPPGRYATQAALSGDLGPGTRQAWSATVPAGRLTAPGDVPAVAVVSVRLRGVGGTGERFTAAGVRVPVPLLGANPHFRPTRLAVVWPLVATPARGAGEAYLDDATGAGLAPNGRLQVLLATGSRPRAGATRRQPEGPARLSWVVDPALLQAAADMREGYSVLQPGGRRTAPGTHRADARSWLAAALPALRAADADQRLLAVPYGDPDVAALQRAGLGDDVATAARRGGQVVREVLGGAARQDVLWPAGGLPASALEHAVPASASALLLPGGLLPPSRDPGHTPGAVSSVQGGGGPLTAVLSDPVLDEVLAAGSRGAAPDSGLEARGETPTPATLVQRVLAETAVVTAELPSRSRDIVAVPPRRWDPKPLFADLLVGQLAAAPWLRLTGLDEVRGDAPDPTPRAADPRYPPDAAARELPRDALAHRGAGVGSQRDRLAALRAVLADQAGPATLRYELALLREESSAWRDDPSTGLALRTSVSRQLGRDVGAVRIASRGLITLASKRGLLPVTLQNDLDYPVTVRLRLRAQSSARLDVADDALHTVAAHRKRTLQVDAEAHTAGVFKVEAQLLTPDADPQDRRPFGDPVELRVRSTAYGAIAVAITIGGLVLLAVAIAVRLVRRLLRMRRAATA